VNNARAVAPRKGRGAMIELKPHALHPCRVAGTVAASATQTVLPRLAEGSETARYGYAGV
jgi:hypothetical protein